MIINYSYAERFSAENLKDALKHSTFVPVNITKPTLLGACLLGRDKADIVTLRFNTLCLLKKFKPFKDSAGLPNLETNA